MDRRQEFERIKDYAVIKDMALSIEECSNPSAAASKILGLTPQTPELACAVINSMSSLGAAYVLFFLKMRMKDDIRAKNIVELAEELQIRGTEGFTKAYHDDLRFLKERRQI